MSTLFETSLSAHYNVAKLLGVPDLHRKLGLQSGSYGSIDLRGWKERLDKLGEGGPLLGGMSTPQKAVKRLTLHHEAERPREPRSDHPRYEEKRAEYAAERARDDEHKEHYDRAPERVSKVRHRHHRSRHATATWALYDWLHHKLHGRSHPVVGPHVVEMLGKPLHERVQGADDLNEAYTQYAASVHSPVLRPSGTASPVPKDFKFIELTVDPKGITRIQAEMVYDDPKATVAGAARKNDPRAWAMNFPELWTSSYRVAIPPDVTNRFANPQPQDDTEIGTAWKGHFFERGQIAFEGISVLAGSVLLYIDFDVKTEQEGAPGSQKGEVKLAYSLYEALTTSVLCFQSPGGPDVDSDHGGDDMRGAPIFVVNIDRDRVKTRSGKHVRYASDVQFSEELNAISLPLWSWSITAGLYNSVPE